METSWDWRRGRQEEGKKSSCCCLGENKTQTSKIFEKSAVSRVGWQHVALAIHINYRLLWWWCWCFFFFLLQTPHCCCTDSIPTNFNNTVLQWSHVSLPHYSLLHHPLSRSRNTHKEPRGKSSELWSSPQNPKAEPRRNLSEFWSLARQSRYTQFLEKTFPYSRTLFPFQLHENPTISEILAPPHSSPSCNGRSYPSSSGVGFRWNLFSFLVCFPLNSELLLLMRSNY